MARIAFFGTPEYACPILKACLEHHEVAYVVTQPDRHGGRGRRTLIESPVKVLAQHAGISVLQPERLSRDADVLATLRIAACDAFVLAAYGQILRRDVLEMTSGGVVGVHASLLPRWRGAAPVAAAIRAGDLETGVTLMRTSAGLDTGAMIARAGLAILPEDTTGSLTARLAELGAELLIRRLPAWLAGELTPEAQDDDAATYARELTKEDGRIEWGLGAVAIERHIRAMSPWPGAFTVTPAGQRLMIWAARLFPGDATGRPAGTVTLVQGGVAVATGKGLLEIDLVQPSGGRAMPADALLRGQPGLAGTVLG